MSQNEYAIQVSLVFELGFSDKKKIVYFQNGRSSQRNEQMR